MKKYKALLINPGWDKNDSQFLWKVKFFRIPPLALATVASMFPENWEVKIIDENIEDGIRYEDIEADLVGITAMTPLAPRAYEICGQFRKKGVPIVFGGAHATMLPDEVAGYADAVVIGEAENVLGKIVSDLENGKLQKKYHSVTPNFLSKPARHDLFRSEKYFLHTVQATRGCPYNCEFCSVSEIYGRKYRKREVDDIINEIRLIKDYKFFFADDNLIGGKIYREWAIELFTKLRKLNKLWATQVSIDFADDPELLRLAARSGCRFVFIGLESNDRETLKSMGKHQNVVRDYKRSIKNFHDCGIAVEGGFIFGHDADDGSVFRSTVEYADKIDLDAMQFTVLTPAPGTRLYKRLDEEGRITKKDYPNDWKLYDYFHVVFKPKNMSPEELKDGFLEAYDRSFTLPKILKRFFKTLISTKNIYSSIMSLYFNLGLRNAAQIMKRELLSRN